MTENILTDEIFNEWFNTELDLIELAESDIIEDEDLDNY